MESGENGHHGQDVVLGVVKVDNFVVVIATDHFLLVLNFIVLVLIVLLQLVMEKIVLFIKVIENG